MKESDYILASDITRVRLVQQLLRDMNVGGNPQIPDEEAKAVRKIVFGWLLRLESKLGVGKQSELDANGVKVL
jgi:hypothetical protein